MYCKYCGKELVGKKTFCGYCGKKTNGVTLNKERVNISNQKNNRNNKSNQSKSHSESKTNRSESTHRKPVRTGCLWALFGFFISVLVVVLFFMSIVYLVKSLSTEKDTMFKCDSNEFYGMDYDDAVKKIEEMGYENVKAVETSEGYARKGKVVEVTTSSGWPVGKKDYSKDTEFIVFYAGPSRVDITDAVEDFENKSYDSIVEAIEEYYLDVTVIEEENTYSAEKSFKAFHMEVNGDLYKGGECWPPLGSSIVIKYYGEGIDVDFSSYDWVDNEDYSYVDVRQHMIDLGFDDVVCYRDTDYLTTGILHKDKTVSKILVDGKDVFYTSNTFPSDSKVEIYVYNYKDKDYDFIQIKVR